MKIPVLALLLSASVLLGCDRDYSADASGEQTHSASPSLQLGRRPIYSMLHDEPFQLFIDNGTRERVKIFANGQLIGDTPLILTLDDLRKCFDPSLNRLVASFDGMRAWIDAEKTPPGRHDHEYQTPGLLLLHLCSHDPTSSTFLFRDESPEGSQEAVAGAFRLEYRGAEGRLLRVGGWSGNSTIDPDGRRKGPQTVSVILADA